MAEYNVTIRPVEPGDALGLARIQIDTWRDAYVGMLPDDTLLDLDDMRAAVRWTRVVGGLRAPEALAVAEIEGRLVGFCHGGAGRRAVAEAVDRLEPVAEVYALYVDPSFQGMGIGRALLADVTRRLIAHGFESLALLTLADNRHGRRFYDRIGGAVGEAIPSVVVGSPADQVPYFWPDMERLVQRLDAPAA
ncbi:N-acetyltransferase [Thalassobaculum fulvum]|uniref:N-acetyltransferase n=1 Tax=Thalassobaculum fulvum TaxID=1633335 RepID=A0A918XT29_9PROT|nr:GNAT family N-acetyltransferase [Thalassobaculum fulvum]GHD49894.1 N-acetyltransferase [Thalassobaculum fulvum]